MENDGAIAPGAGIVVFCCWFSGRGSQVESWTAAAHWESDGSGAPTGSSEKYPDAEGGPSDGAGLGVGVGVGAGVGVGVGIGVEVAVDVDVGVGVGVVVSIGDSVASAVGVLGAHVFDLWHLRAPFVSAAWLNGPVPAMATPNAAAIASATNAVAMPARARPGRRKLRMVGPPVRSARSGSLVRIEERRAAEAAS